MNEIRNKLLEGLGSNKTKQEKEQNYFLISVFLTEHLTPNDFHMNYSKIYNSNYSNLKKSAMSSRLFILSMYYEANSIEEVKQRIFDEICRVLEAKREDLEYDLNELKYLCEYEAVLHTAYLFGTGVNRISLAPKRDRKKIYSNKKSFEKKKAAIIEFLKEHNSSNEIVEQHIENMEFYTKEDISLYENYESTLKHTKALLKDELMKHCNTGEQRAADITKIVNYF